MMAVSLQEIVEAGEFRRRGRVQGRLTRDLRFD